MSTSSALRRDKKKASGLVPIDVDVLAGNITADAKGEGCEGTPTGWTWPEDGCTRVAWQGKGPGDGQCATSGTYTLHFAEDVAEQTETCCTVEGAAGSFILFVATLHGLHDDVGVTVDGVRDGKPTAPGWCTNTRHMPVPGVLEFPFVLGCGFDVAEIEVLVWAGDNTRLVRLSFVTRSARRRVQKPSRSSTLLHHQQSHTQLLLP